MTKPRIDVIIALWILASSTISAQEFPLHYQLPVDVFSNQVVELDELSVEEHTRSALQRSFDSTWLAAYVPQSILSAFVTSYAGILDSKLPASQVQIGKARRRASLWEVPFSVHHPSYYYGTFVWTENDQGAFVLLSLSVNQTEMDTVSEE